MLRTRSGTLLPAVIAIVLTGLNLRIAIVAVGPLTNQIQASTGMGSGPVGLLTTIPFLLMGVSALFGGRLIHRRGPHGVIVIGLVLLTAGCLIRSATDNGALIIAGTVPVGIGIALMGLALPAAVKQFTPGQAGPVTSAYVAALSLGVGLVGLIIVPLSDLTGGWQLALLICCAATIPALFAWLTSSAPGRAPREISAQPPQTAPRADRTVILLTIVFTLQSFGFAAVVNWAPVALSESGWSEHTAAAGTALIGFLNAFGAILISRLSRRGDRRLWLALALVVQAVGVIGLSQLAGQLGVLWPAIFGFGAGSAFALLLTMPIHIGTDTRQVATVSAWMMGIGYALAAVGPWLVGVMRDGEIGLPAALLLVGITGLVSGAVALALPSTRTEAEAPAPR